MTTPAGQDPGQQQQPPAGTDPEAGRIKSLDQRFGAIEAKQAEHDSKLDRILAALPGGTPKSSDSGGTGGSSPTPATGAGTSNIAQLVRQGVAELDAERQQREAADKAAAADKAWRSSVDQRLAEHPPAEPAGKMRRRLQRALLGKDNVSR